jgi:transcriptional regulator with XRE-family HTH domain
MSELTEKFKEEFKDKETRRVYVDDFLNTVIATQIKVLREQRCLTQAQLAELADMRQERISVLEDVDYSSWTINVLRRLAEAFDLRLSVKFESFGSFLHEFDTFGRKALEKPSFDDDPAFQNVAAGVSTTTAYDIDIAAFATATPSEEWLEYVRRTLDSLQASLPLPSESIESTAPDEVELEDDTAEVGSTAFSVESTDSAFYARMPELDHTENLPS